MRENISLHDMVEIKLELWYFYIKKSGKKRDFFMREESQFLTL